MLEWERGSGVLSLVRSQVPDATPIDTAAILRYPVEWDSWNPCSRDYEAAYGAVHLQLAFGALHLDDVIGLKSAAGGAIQRRTSPDALSVPTFKSSLKTLTDWATHNFPLRPWAGRAVTEKKAALRLEDLKLGAEPVLGIVAVFAAAALVELECALPDLVLRSVELRRCRLAGRRGFDF